MAVHSNLFCRHLLTWSPRTVHADGLAVFSHENKSEDTKRSTSTLPDSCHLVEVPLTVPLSLLRRRRHSSYVPRRINNLFYPSSKAGHALILRHFIRLGKATRFLLGAQACPGLFIDPTSAPSSLEILFQETIAQYVSIRCLAHFTSSYGTKTHNGAKRRRQSQASHAFCLQCMPSRQAALLWRHAMLWLLHFWPPMFLQSLRPSGTTQGREK